MTSKAAESQTGDPMDGNALEVRLRHLERKILYLTGFCGILLGLLVLTVAGSSMRQVGAAESPKVLHLRGLVIEDAQGRARILLGAPFPTVHERMRQDATSTAMIFLDEQGHDRFSIGEKMPAQLNGKVSSKFRRIGSGYGLTIYDPEGNERGGMGFLSNGSTVNRAAFALDRPDGDAVGLIVDDKTGFAGLVSIYPHESHEIDHKRRDATGVVIGTQGEKAYVTVKDLSDAPRATLGIGPGQEPSFHLFDQAGNSSPDLLSTAH